MLRMDDIQAGWPERYSRAGARERGGEREQLFFVGKKKKVDK